MGAGPLPLAELIKINDQNVADVEGITDLLQDAPFLAAVQADTASNGTQHKYLKEVTAPVVGFRAANDGRDHQHSEDELVTIDLKILDCSHHHDQALVDEYKNGADAFMAREGNRHMQAGFATAEGQLIYGTVNDAKGHAGIIQAAPVATLAGGMVVNATGTTALSSVYAVRSTGDLRDFLLITGNEGNISMGAIYQQMMQGSAAGMFNSYVQPITAHLGCQYGSIYSIGRIANLDAGTKTLNDDLISQLLALFPASRPATHLLMNRRSRQQLQASRTATNQSGAPAPFPTEAFGVPIVTSDQVRNNETAVA